MLTNLHHSTPDTFVVDPDKPETNGPFLIYQVPDFPGAKEGTEHKGFYIIMPVDHRFPDMDEETTWYSAYVSGSHHVLFKFPAWPYALWPKADNGEILYDSILDQVPECVRKSLNNCHAVFDPDGSAGHAGAAEVEARKWEYAMLDFSQIKGIGELSSRVLYDQAGDKDTLDYDLIEVPLYFDSDTSTISHYQTFLGFKVGSVDPEGPSGRKVARSGTKKSALQLKREAKLAAQQG